MNFCLDNCALLYVVDPLNEPFCASPRFGRVRCMSVVGIQREKDSPSLPFPDADRRRKIRRDVRVGLRITSASRTKLRNFVVGVCRSHIPDIRSCYEGENGRRKKKIRRAKRNTYPYPTTSFHFRSLPDAGPLYFLRHLSWFIPEEEDVESTRTSSKTRRKTSEEGGKAFSLVSYEELIDLVRRYAEILRSDQLRVQAREFLFRGSSRPSIFRVRIRIFTTQYRFSVRRFVKS